MSLVKKNECSHCALGASGLCCAFAEQDARGREALQAAHWPMRRLKAGDVIYSQGDTVDLVYSLISGWVDLHQDTADGRRQISRFLLPGALFGFEPRGASASQGATALTSTAICPLPLSRFDEMRRNNASFNENFLWMLERENHMATEALTVMCQGSAMERVAYILWELATRLSGAGAVSTNALFKIPLTQRIIAEATGLTAIHVNRIIGRLRLQHLVELHDGVMIVRDPKKLSALALSSNETRDLWRGRNSSSNLPLGASALVA
jgi:CRP-like cAMP-binding protein